MHTHMHIQHTHTHAHTHTHTWQSVAGKQEVGLGWQLIHLMKHALSVNTLTTLNPFNLVPPLGIY